MTASDTIANQSVQRPVYPYPLVPKFNGNGADPSLVTSFHPVTSPHANDYSNWIGNYLFYRPDSGSGPGRHARGRRT